MIQSLEICSLSLVSSPGPVFATEGDPVRRDAVGASHTAHSSAVRGAIAVAQYGCQLCTCVTHRHSSASLLRFFSIFSIFTFFVPLAAAAAAVAAAAAAASASASFAAAACLAASLAAFLSAFLCALR